MKHHFKLIGYGPAHTHETPLNAAGWDATLTEFQHKICLSVNVVFRQSPCPAKFNEKINEACQLVK